jgi:hypothetical protein
MEQKIEGVSHEPSPFGFFLQSTGVILAICGSLSGNRSRNSAVRKAVRHMTITVTITIVTERTTASG